MTTGEHTPPLAPCGVAGSRFPYGCAIESLNLAIDHNSLARFSKRIIRHCSTLCSALLLPCRISLLLPGFRLFSPSVKSSFQYSLTLLLHYRSRDVFRVGSLCLPNSRAISNARYSGYLANSIMLFHTGLSPSVASLSSELLVGMGGYTGSKHHISLNSSLRDSVCPLPCSIAFTSGISIDFFSCGY
jgi:hypothetical protein